MNWNIQVEILESDVNYEMRLIQVHNEFSINNSKVGFIQVYATTEQVQGGITMRWEFK